MKKSSFIFVVFFLLSSILFTKGVIRTIPSPPYPYGLTFDGTNLWVGTSSTHSDKIYKIDTLNGNLIDSIPIPFIPPSGSYTTKGLAWDGQYLWVFLDLPSAYHPDKFYKVDTADGSIITTFNSPQNNYIGGMTFVNSNIWFSFYYPNDILIGIDTISGTAFDTIITQGEQPMGVAYDGGYLWCAEDTGFGATKKEIYQYDINTGNYTGVFIRNPDLSPRDMTWDGNNLWLIGYYSRLIYQINVSSGTPNIAVNDSTIEFDNVEINDTLNIDLYVYNTGDDTLHILNLIFPDSSFFSDSTIFPIYIPDNSQIIIPISFSPYDYGYDSSVMSIVSNDPLDSIFEIILSGKGLYSNPTIHLSDTFNDYGNIWISGDGLTGWEFKIINRSISTLSIDSINLLSDNFFIDSLPFTIFIQEDDSINIRVWFNPTQVLTYFDTLEIFSNDTNPSLVILEGTGVEGPYTLGYLFWQFQTPDNPYGSNYDKRIKALKSIPDINFDGIDDIIISTGNYLTICLNGASANYADTFWIFNTGVDNNNTGSISLNGMFSAQKALQIIDDINNDGFSDVIICTDGGNEHVYAIDGVTGVEIWSFGDDYDPYKGGFGAVDVKRDFNNDGIKDVLAVASSNSSGLGYKGVYCFNGINGNIIWKYSIPENGLASGYSIVSIDDITGDSIPEVVAGYGGDGVTKFARALNGNDGTFIWQFSDVINGAKEMLEYPITDSTSDVIIANYWNNLYRVDGETGNQIWLKSIGSGYSGIIQINLIEDVNNNGYTDIIVANFSSSSNIFCIDGETGQNIFLIPTDDYRSYGVCAIPDIDGDGINDVIAGDQSGKLYIYSAGKDSLIYSHIFSERIYCLNYINSIDGNSSPEIVVGLDDGQVFCISGGNIETGVEEIHNDLKDLFIMKNFPNPFSNKTNIFFSLPNNNFISLKIFNIAGQIVSTPIENKYFLQGSYNLEFNGENLVPGIYYYQLQTERKNITDRMILIR